ncbi:MAG TPA: hypothetical protein VG944_19095 [Fimbriimonas sp.]|nr:hypothetical protein [Fimbriimonas sp.]
MRSTKFPAARQDNVNLYSQQLAAIGYTRTHIQRTLAWCYSPVSDDSNVYFLSHLDNGETNLRPSEGNSFIEVNVAAAEYDWNPLIRLHYESGSPGY